MSLATYRDHDNRAPALIVAVALHVGAFALILFLPGGAPQAPIGSSVPINIVSNDPFTDTRPAVQAPETQAAATPTPTPKAAPQPPAEVAALPAFSPAAKPKPQQAKPVVEQPSLHPTRPAASSAALISHLQSIIDNAQRTSGQQASSAQRGPARAETAPQARPNAGTGYSQSDQVGLEQLLDRLWNPNCHAPGGADVHFQARFTVAADGSVGKPNVGGLEASADPVIAAAARRAIDAVHEVEPYAVPFRGQTIVANFDAKEACAKR